MVDEGGAGEVKQGECGEAGEKRAAQANVEAVPSVVFPKMSGDARAGGGVSRGAGDAF